MIGNMLNKTEVGYFATAGKFVDLILFLPAILVQTITPILVREKECDSYSYEAKKRTFVGITTWVSLLMALAISLSAYWMIIYTYGEKYALAIPVLQIMAFKAVGMALSAAGGQIIIIEHIQKWAFIRNVLGCFLCVILNYLFIPKYGIIGSAIVTVITDTRNVGKDAMTAEGTVNRAALPAIFNPEDLNALEQALRLKEQNPGSTVGILTMGPPRAGEIIRQGLYRGADTGWLLTDRLFAGADTLATSYALATGIQKIGDVDIVIGGRQAIDGEIGRAHV